MNDIVDNELLTVFYNDLNEIKDLESLKLIHARYLGTNGSVTALLKKIPAMSNEDKKKYGTILGSVKNEINSALENKKREISDAQVAQMLSADSIDVTLPARPRNNGYIHPCNFVLNEAMCILHEMGFEHVEGREIEDDFHNFTALNTPKNHPARQMQDTFYLSESLPGTQCDVLRTQTSNAQIHTMLNRKPPLCIVSPGRVFRRDFDATHTPQFHQIEGLCVRDKVSIAELTDCLRTFVEKFFIGCHIKFRFRPSYFPFTEPSMEMDIQIEGSDWLEILGCGMVHPNVFRNVGIDPEKYTGFAFGMGIERLVMLKYNISDIRELFETDLRWLQGVSFPPVSYAINK